MHILTKIKNLNADELHFRFIEKIIYLVYNIDHIH
jgi:hypothetical protein